MIRTVGRVAELGHDRKRSTFVLALELRIVQRQLGQQRKKSLPGSHPNSMKGESLEQRECGIEAAYVGSTFDKQVVEKWKMSDGMEHFLENLRTTIWVVRATERKMQGAQVGEAARIVTKPGNTTPPRMYLHGSEHRRVLGNIHGYTPIAFCRAQGFKFWKCGALEKRVPPEIGKTLLGKRE